MITIKGALKPKGNTLGICPCCDCAVHLVHSKSVVNYHQKLELMLFIYFSNLFVRVCIGIFFDGGLLAAIFAFNMVSYLNPNRFFRYLIQSHCSYPFGGSQIYNIHIIIPT